MAQPVINKGNPKISGNRPTGQINMRKVLLLIFPLIKMELLI